MSSVKKSKKQKKIKKLSFKNRGFSAFFVIVVVAVGIFLAGAFESLPTTNPVQGIIDPKNNFANVTGKDSLQLRTLGFITVTPTQAQASSGSDTATGLCQSGGANSEAKILVGYSPTTGQSVSAGGQIKVWVNDENPPCVGTGEVADPTTGLITTVGNRTEKSTSDGYLWEPALYISPQRAESGGTPHFPTAIRGVYNNAAKSGDKCDGNTHQLNGPAIDPLPAGANIKESYTDEYLWDVNSLGLTPGSYTAEFVIHDGDDDRGVGCVNISIQ